MAKYMISGVAGFIGSALARAILEQDHEVIGVDNFATGSLENIADIRDGFELIEGDIRDESVCARACAGADYVLHQAALPSVPRSVTKPWESNSVNVDGTLRLLIAARDAGVRRFVFAGSSSAYGDQPVLLKNEGMIPDPISPYAVAKLAGEYYLKSFYRCYGLETVVLRYFNIFGPRQDPTSPYSAVLAKFITQMLEGKQPTINGDGEQSRDFTYIDNAVQANLKACIAPSQMCSGRVFNIACGERISLSQVFRLLSPLCGFQGEPIYGPERSGDIKHSLSDITAAREALDYNPQVRFAEGLRKTVEWYAARRIKNTAIA